MRKSVFLIVVIALSACNYYPSTTKAAATPNTIDITNTSMPPSSIPPTEMHLPPVIVDPNTMNHKLLMGYQGWFTCPGDGANTGWFHWFKDDIPDAAHFRVDMFPDASELTPEERCETGMKYPNGETAPLYSAYNPKTVMRHFQWMSDYEIDGIFLQRFVGELADPIYSNQRNIVLKNVRAAAEAHGRVFAIMYDISGMDSTTLIEEVEHDWKYLTNILKVTESPAYLRHDGKPVLAIWGLGFNGRPGTPGQAMELVNFFKNNDEQKYEVTLMGGVPTWWRELKNDSLTDPAWADYYCALDVISPWTVGRYSTDSEVDQYRSVMEADMKRVAECGAQYMPVVFPGTAFHNDSGSPFNSTPRRGGELYWRQVHNAVSIGVPMIYNAMFDEVDEGTAMYKIAATKNDQPAGVDLISMDTDGVKLPNDWYLRLAGAATKMLRGEIPNTERIPLNPDGSLVSAFPTVEPTPVQFKARIQITTTSDWTTLSMLSGGQLSGVEIISSNSEGDASFDDLTFTLSQPLERANAGSQVEMIVDFNFSDLQAEQKLTFVIKRGSIGSTTVTLMNYLGAEAVTVETVDWGGLSGSTGENPIEFTVLSDMFMK